MALTHVDHDGVPDLTGVRFPMTDGTKTVSVLVTYEALQDVHYPPPTEGEYLERLAEHRGLFEEIASRKYDNGQTANGGGVIITTADLR